MTITRQLRSLAATGLLLLRRNIVFCRESGTAAHGINDTGEVVGGGSHGFLFRPTGRPGTGIGTYTTIDGPSGTSILDARGINDSGQIVGEFANSSGNHGFLLSGSSFITLDDPLATQGTLAFGINNLGQIVGEYRDSLGAHGFLLSGGTYFTLDDPLAIRRGQAIWHREAERLCGRQIDDEIELSRLFRQVRGFDTAQNVVDEFSSSAEKVGKVWSGALRII
jgi:probable HAF family extracellular repeat protein